MSIIVLGLIFLSVLLSVAAQILLKHGMSSAAVVSSMQNGAISGFTAIATNMSVILGLTAYGLSAGFWLLVLSRLDVSKAYPFVGLGFILTMIFAYFFLNEPMTLFKVIGTVLVCAGVILISQS